MFRREATFFIAGVATGISVIGLVHVYLHFRSKNKQKFNYDAVILHAAGDSEKANQCREKIHSFRKIVFLDDVIKPGRPLLSGITTLLKTCRLVVILHTTQLVKDDLVIFSRDLNLHQCLSDEKPVKRQRVIIVLADDEVPYQMLSSYICLKYDDKDFKQNIDNLIKEWRDILP